MFFTNSLSCSLISLDDCLTIDVYIVRNTHTEAPSISRRPAAPIKSDVRQNTFYLLNPIFGPIIAIVYVYIYVHNGAIIVMIIINLIIKVKIEIVLKLILNLRCHFFSLCSIHTVKLN